MIETTITFVVGLAIGQLIWECLQGKLVVSPFWKYAGLVTFHAGDKSDSTLAVHFGIQPSHWSWGRGNCSMSGLETWGLGPFILIAWF